tara:strand:+ start:726 stop:1409 length:684 start_codon:yes stop_codon:yes gene_type:complete
MYSNKKRKCPANQWTWTSKLYNASALAEEATEQANTIETLELALKCARDRNDEISRVIGEWKVAYQQWKATLKSTQQKSEAMNQTIVSLKATNVVQEHEIDKLKVELQEMRAVKDKEIDQLNLELQELRAVKDKEISEFEKKLHETNRECVENRARKKIWKKKYEELANMGAVALAKVTKESYGVTPEEFQAYKHIADTQFQVDKAEKMRTNALNLLHANTRVLEDK